MSDAPERKAFLTRPFPDVVRLAPYPCYEFGKQRNELEKPLYVAHVVLERIDGTRIKKIYKVNINVEIQL